MIDNKSKKILDSGYTDLVREVVDYIIFHDEQAKALELSRHLTKAVQANSLELRVQPQLQRFYQEAIQKLQFICLPALEGKEVISLIKNNFCLQLELPDYDLTSKFEGTVLNIIVAEDRNNFKEEARKALLENSERITPSYEIKTVSDWLKNYISKVGLEDGDKLARAQYIVSLKNNKSISAQECDNLLVLFKFYDDLNVSADSPQGLNEESPISIDGKLYIFRKGAMEPVLDKRDVEEAMSSVSEDNEINAVQPEVSGPSSAQSLPELSVSPIFTVPVSPSELEQALANYAPTSLEYKALKQEINRLKVSAFKQAQKSPQSNVKK
jgi:hypothetical protein